MAAIFGPRPYGPSEFLLGLEQMYCFFPAVVLNCMLANSLPELCGKPLCVRRNALLWTKLGVAVALAGVQTSIVVRWCQSGVSSNTLDIVGAVLSCTSALSLVALVYVRHLYVPQTKPFLSMFLVYTLLFDVVLYESYFNPPCADGVRRPSRALVVLKLGLLYLEQVSKRRFVINSHLISGLGPDSDIPLVRFLRNIFVHDFETELTLENTRKIKAALEQKQINELFARRWKYAEKDSPDSLFWACFMALRGQLWDGLLPQLLFVLVTITQPLFLSEFITAASTPNTPPEVTKKLIIAAAIIYSSIATLRAWRSHLRTKYMLSIRGILTVALYQKSLKLKEQSPTTTELHALLDSEVNTAVAFFAQCYEVVPSVLGIAFHTILLMRLTWYSGILVLLPVFAPMRVGVQCGRISHDFQQIWRKHTDDRIAATSNILAQLKDIKMLGLGPAMARMLQGKQQAEVNASMRARVMSTVRFAVSAFSDAAIGVTAVGMALFIAPPPQMFTIPHFFAILATISGIIRTSSSLVTFFAAAECRVDNFSRMQKYMLQVEIVDKRSLTRQQMSRPNLANPVDGVPRTLPLRRSQRLAAPRYVVRFVDVALTVGLKGPLLSGIRITVPQDKIAMIYSKTGRGKSTILEAIIGRVRPVKGHVIVSTTTSIAYCRQNPWIQNLTIRDNIVGANEYDAYWLRRVIYICALDVDLTRLPKGDLTMVGMDGCNLSGGQRQRIELARGLYARTKLLILDDVFSSLDMATSSTIRVRLFGGNQVLRANGITLIMSTSMPEHCVDADVSYEIKDDGRVVERSEESRANSPHYQPARNRQGDDGDASTAAVTASNLPNLPLVQSTSNTPEADLDPSKPSSGGIDLYLYALRSAGTGALVTWGLSIAASAITEKLSDVFASVWLATAADDRTFYNLYAIIGLLNPIMNFVASASNFYFVYPAVTAALHWRLTEKTFHATYDYLSSSDAGHLLSKFSRDIYITTLGLPNCLLPLGWGVVTVLLNAVMLSVPFSSVIPLIFFPSVTYALWMCSKDVSRRLGILQASAKKDLMQFVDETNTGLQHIYAFHWQDAFSRRWEEIVFELQAVHYRRRRVIVTSHMMVDFATTFAAMLGVACAPQSSSVTTIIVLAHAALRLNRFEDDAGVLVAAWTFAEDSLGAVSRIRKFETSTPQETTEARWPEVPAQWPQQGKVVLNCVSAAYKPEDGSPVSALSHVSVTANPGEIICISGRSGSGKTSIFMSMLRMLEFTGSISIDNREVRTVPHDVLRSRITTITQTGIQLKGSVRFNMDPFDPALRPREFLLTDDMMIGILRRVDLWQRIEEQGGLDADMLQLRLSFGEKQLFQLARAILHKQTMRTKLVLIDEATSGLDPDTDQLMQRVIQEVFNDCTALVVSHRPSMFQNADQIVKLTNGESDVYRHQRERRSWRPTTLRQRRVR
ncbi:hypothetical protein PWT90_03893 [Aphanocladium album]|nr:hypothetical protein PWT90_03893 [Aphanocladium album]